MNRFTFGKLSIRIFLFTSHVIFAPFFVFPFFIIFSLHIDKSFNKSSLFSLHKDKSSNKSSFARGGILETLTKGTKTHWYYVFYCFSIVKKKSQKHAFIILTTLNTTFI